MGIPAHYKQTKDCPAALPNISPPAPPHPPKKPKQKKRQQVALSDNIATCTTQPPSQDKAKPALAQKPSHKTPQHPNIRAPRAASTAQSKHSPGGKTPTPSCQGTTFISAIKMVSPHIDLERIRTENMPLTSGVGRLWLFQGGENHIQKTQETPRKVKGCDVLVL